MFLQTVSVMSERVTSASLVRRSLKMCVVDPLWCSSYISPSQCLPDLLIFYFPLSLLPYTFSTAYPFLVHFCCNVLPFLAWPAGNLMYIDQLAQKSGKQFLQPVAKQICSIIQTKYGHCSSSYYYYLHLVKVKERK